MLFSMYIMMFGKARKAKTGNLNGISTAWRLRLLKKLNKKVFDQKQLNTAQPTNTIKKQLCLQIVQNHGQDFL